MRHNVQQFSFFLIFKYILAQKQALGKMFEYSFHVILHLFPHSTQYVDKSEQQKGTLCSSDFALKHLQPGSPVRKLVICQSPS